MNPRTYAVVGVIFCSVVTMAVLLTMRQGLYFVFDSAGGWWGTAASIGLGLGGILIAWMMDRKPPANPLGQKDRLRGPGP